MTDSEMIQSDALRPFPTDWDRALAVVAHPDDMEYGASSAVARWTSEGRDVAYLLVTEGEAGIASMQPAMAGPVRRAEQSASCERVGVRTLEFLDHPDGLVVADLRLRRDIAAAIRRHRPDVILSINFRPSWGGPSWNHADHRNVGLALLDAVRDAGNPWLFADIEDAAWNGAHRVAFNSSPRATHFVELTEVDLAAGVDSLRCHDVYLRELGGGEMSDPTEFLGDNARDAGRRAGVPLAVTFEIMEL